MSKAYSQAEKATIKLTVKVRCYKLESVTFEGKNLDKLVTINQSTHASLKLIYNFENSKLSTIKISFLLSDEADELYKLLENFTVSMDVGDVTCAQKLNSVLLELPNDAYAEFMYGYDNT